MKAVFLYLSSLSVLFYSPLFAKEPRGPQCTDYASAHLGRNISFCLHRSQPGFSQTNEPVVYFFHGLGGDAGSWESNGYAAALESQIADAQDFPAATFVSFDTNMDSYFSDYGGETEGSRAFETWMIKEFIPYIEKTYGVCAERKCRAAAGLSMGGFGALKTALKFPNMFFAAAANSPALPPFSIHEPTDKWRDYFARHPIGVLQGMFLLNRTKNVFPTPEIYAANDPITLVNNFPIKGPVPALYFDMGGKDDFGFEEGFAVLKSALDSKQIPYSSYFEPTASHKLYEKRNADVIKFLREKFL